MIHLHNESNCHCRSCACAYKWSKKWLDLYTTFGYERCKFKHFWHLKMDHFFSSSPTFFLGGVYICFTMMVVVVEIIIESQSYSYSLTQTSPQLVFVSNVFEILFNCGRIRWKNIKWCEMMPLVFGITLFGYHFSPRAFIIV